MANVKTYRKKYTRKCHDCGRPTNNYRCDKCWAKLRKKGEYAEETGMDTYHSFFCPA